jgi:CRP-like cAMP-binding protein
MQGGAPVSAWDGVVAQVPIWWQGLSDPAQALAFGSAAVAALLVVVSAFVKTMIPLRWLAVGSNLGFVVYGVLQANVLLVLLHSVLLPVNLWRVRQMVGLTRRVQAAAIDPQSLQVWLRPYMRSRRLPAGRLIFASGDVADRMYLLVDGLIELPEVGRTLEAGRMFGEIAFFAPERRRSSSAVCVTDCTLMSIDEDTFRQLVHQNPDFGLQVMLLIAGRLSDDVQRLQSAAAPAPGQPGMARPSDLAGEPVAERAADLAANRAT